MIYRAPGYPFGEFVPVRILLLRTFCVPGKLAWILEIQNRVAPVLIRGMRLQAWTDSDGSVSAVLPNGNRFRLSYDEFSVIEWAPAPADSIRRESGASSSLARG